MGTRWRSKYGGGFDHIDPSKSGLTPVDSIFPPFAAEADPAVLLARQAAENYQRKRLHGFTSKELQDLDCIPTRELKPGNLSNEIIPLLRKERWERIPAQPEFTRDKMYPVIGNQGDWSAHNPVIWAILEPILVLTSKYIMSAHMSPWFDALLAGEKRKIDPSRIAEVDKGCVKEDLLQSIHARPAWVAANSDTVARDQALSEVVSKFNCQFGFSDPYEDPRGTAEEYVILDNYGVTFMNEGEMRYARTPTSKWRLFVFLNYKYFQPLLRNDLNSAEKLILEWQAANTLIHEIQHLIVFTLKDYEDPVSHALEYYFEDECIMEIGFSFENAMNGGSSFPMVDDRRMPFGWWHTTKYPTCMSVVGRIPAAPVLLTPDLDPWADLFPLPMSFFEDSQEETFWDLGVRRFGHNVFHYRSINVGIRTGWNVDPISKHMISKVPTSTSRILNTNVPTVRTKISLNLYPLLAPNRPEVLTPADLEKLRFGLTMLNSAKLSESFFNASTAQQASIDALAGCMTEANFGIRLNFTSSFFRLTCGAHETVIKALLAEESQNKPTIFTARRRDLLIFNTGARILAKKFPDTVYPSLDNEHARLETCRMNLWSPVDPNTMFGPNWEEFHTLHNARSLITEQNPRESCSLFCKTAAQICIAAADRDVLTGWLDRVKELGREGEAMKWLAERVEGWTKDAWVFECDGWAEWARRLGNQPPRVQGGVGSNRTIGGRISRNRSPGPGKGKGRVKGLRTPPKTPKSGRGI